MSIEERDGPFHAGEIAIQARLGVRDKIESIGRRIIRDYMPREHRGLFAQLPFLVVGWVDAAARPWASLVVGAPGFVASPDPRTLIVGAPPIDGDPLRAALASDGDAPAAVAPGAAVGLLGIELPTRRRNRVNGVVTRADADAFHVRVHESFGNCPKYIQTRALVTVATAIRPEAALDARAMLTPWARRMIATADTLFVASYVDRDPATRLVDVSHRGGRPGFVDVGGDGTLTVPDFTGNFLFNTLGNLLTNPRAGIVIPSFATGDVLYLTGDTEIVWDGADVAAIRGADRLWRLRPRAAVGVRAAFPLRGELIEYSPRLP